MKHALRFVCLIALLVPTAVAQGGSCNDSASAVNLAWQYLGIDHLVKQLPDSLDFEIRQVHIADSLQPYIADSVFGRPVWEVRFKALSMSMRRCAGPRDYAVRLDPETGRLLMISYVHSTDFTLVSPQPSGKAVEDFVARSNSTYHGYCEGVPRMGLLAAARFAAPSRPFEAKQMYAFLLQISRDGSVEDVWIIIGRGVPQLEGDFDDDCRASPPDNWVTWVDARTGASMLTGNDLVGN